MLEAVAVFSTPFPERDAVKPGGGVNDGKRRQKPVKGDEDDDCEPEEPMKKLGLLGRDRQVATRTSASSFGWLSVVDAGRRSRSSTVRAMSIDEGDLEARRLRHGAERLRRGEM